MGQATCGSSGMINGVPRILVIRLSAIGDVVRVLPGVMPSVISIQMPRSIGLSSRNPPRSSKITPPSTSCGFSNEGQVGLENAAFVRCRSRRERYDIVVDFHGIFKSGMIMLWSGAKQRLGFARPRSQEGSWLFCTRGVRLVSQRMNRIEENLELVKALEARRHHLDVEIAISPEIEEAVHEYVHSQFDGAKTKVGVHVPVERPEKQWPFPYLRGTLRHALGGRPF